MLQVRSLLGQLFDANCYVVWDDNSPEGARSALVVDPGPGTADRVRELLFDNKLDLGAILLTHGHVDHVWDAAALSGDVVSGTESVVLGSVPVYITEPDARFMDDPVRELGLTNIELGLSKWEKPDSLTVIRSLAFEPVSGIHMRVIPAPGHSPGSAVFLFSGVEPQTPTAFSGDVVFAGSVGRTDLVGGGEREMQQSLRTLSNVLDPRTTLFPGHGDSTVWADEMQTNPFVKRAMRQG